MHFIAKLDRQGNTVKAVNTNPAAEPRTTDHEVKGGPVKRNDHKPLPATHRWGWRYHHTGIPTGEPRQGEEYRRERAGYAAPMKTLALPVALVLLLLTAPAGADQQQWVSRVDADRAAAMLPPGESVRFFCAPCGDESWTPAEVVQLEVLHTGSGGYWEVHLNGDAVDLAYTYVMRRGQWENLALALGLEAFDVPRFLDGEDVEDPARALAAAEDELARLELALARTVPVAAHRLDRSRSAWQRYRDAQVALEAEVIGSADAGTAARLRLTRQRAAEILALVTMDP